MSWTRRYFGQADRPRIGSRQTDNKRRRAEGGAIMLGAGVAVFEEQGRGRCGRLRIWFCGGGCPWGSPSLGWFWRAAGRAAAGASRVPMEISLHCPLDVVTSCRRASQGDPKIPERHVLQRDAPAILASSSRGRRRTKLARARLPACAAFAHSDGCAPYFARLPPPLQVPRKRKTYRPSSCLSSHLDGPVQPPAHHRLPSPVL